MTNPQAQPDKLKQQQQQQQQQSRDEELTEKEEAGSQPERTEQEEDLISPNADTDLVEGGIRNDAVLGGEGVAHDWEEEDEEEEKK